VSWPTFVLTLNRIGPYVIVWVTLVLVVAFTPLAIVWHGADYWILARVLHLGEGLAPDRDLAIVDLDVPDGGSTAALRSREIAFADALNAAGGFAPVATRSGSCPSAARHLGPRKLDTAEAPSAPAAVVFDISFSAEASRVEPGCVDPLVRELHALRMLGVKVYAAQDLESTNGGGSITGRFQIDPNFERNQDPRIYAQITQSGHTLFTSDPELPGGPLFYYPKVVRIPSAAGGDAGVTGSCALPIVTAGRSEDVCLSLLSQDPDSEAADEVVALGTTAAFHAAVTPFAQAVAHAGALAGKVVLVGDEAIDTAPGDPRSKFEVLAWALSQSLADVHGRPAPRVLIDTTVMLALSLLGAFLGLGAFLFGFATLRRSRLRLPAAVGLGLALPLAVIAATEAVFLAHAQLYSQLSLPIFTVLATVGVAFWGATNALKRDLLVTQLQARETSVAQRYDVFISYARTAENSKWVEEHLLAPLSQLRTPGGAPLRIFFDRQSIKIGYSWYTTIVEAVYGSRFFIPVYSEGYFDRPFCRDELDIAMLRQVELGSFILPVARVRDGIPTRYARVQFVDAADPEFFEAIAAALVQTPVAQPAAGV
jgi:hypothetical protein